MQLMPEPVNVLYISYDGMTDPLGQSQVLPYLCALSVKGYKITLLSCEKPSRFNQSKNIIEDICNQADINWQPIPYTTSPPVVSTIRDIYMLKKKARALHKRYHFKIVHCRSYISALIGLDMKHKFKTKFLFDMRGFWADERVEGGLWNLQNPLYNIIYKFFKKKEKQYFEQADQTISLTYLGKNEIHSWDNLKNQPIPITIIPCCVDTDLFDPSKISQEQKESLRKRLNISASEPVLGYLGSIGTWYMLEEMLDFFKQLKNKYPNAKMLFVSPEPKEMVINKAYSLDIDESSIIITSAKRKEVPLYISIMNYSIFFIKPCFSKKASSPTKQGEIMSMGIPVICNAGIGDTGYVVEKYRSGIAIDNFTEEAYGRAIEDLTMRQFSRADIRQGAINFYGLEKGVENYEAVYKLLSK